MGSKVYLKACNFTMHAYFFIFYIAGFLVMNLEIRQNSGFNLYLKWWISQETVYLNVINCIILINWKIDLTFQIKTKTEWLVINFCHSNNKDNHIFFHKAKLQSITSQRFFSKHATPLPRPSTVKIHVDYLNENFLKTLTRFEIWNNEKHAKNQYW